MTVIRILEHPEWLEKNKEVIIVWEEFLFKGKLKIIERKKNEVQVRK